MSFEIALIHPDIPQNTGNIARLCVGLAVPLHLVKPMGFVLDDKKLKRAGLDYWPHLELTVHAHLSVFLAAMQGRRLFFFSTKGQTRYTAVDFQHRDVLVFGSESHGLPPELLTQASARVLTLPMPGQVRSLNVSNAVAVAAYEAHRQLTS